MGSVGVSVPFPKPIEITLPRSLLGLVKAPDIAMDLGTANTLIYEKGRGIILNEPSIVAIDEELRKPVAVGHAAREMYGKTSRAIRCIRPMKDGVIADFSSTTVMIRYMLRNACPRRSLLRPRLVVGVPSGITQVEKRAVIDAALCSGVREVRLVEEAMAAAIGCGLPVEKCVGNMIIDIGGGTTEVAVITMNATLYSHSIRVAGDEMDEAIQRHIRREYGVDVGLFEAERIKIVIGSALPSNDKRELTVYGREISTGYPQEIVVTDSFIREALEAPVEAIVGSVLTAIENLSPEIVQDVMVRGCYLAGGGALLKGLAQKLSIETGMTYHRSQDPLTTVVRGVGAIVEELKDRRSLCIA